MSLFGKGRTEKQLSAKISRHLRLLRVHGIIRKLPNQNRYQATLKGARLIKLLSAILAASTEELLEKAAWISCFLWQDFRSKALTDANCRIWFQEAAKIRHCHPCQDWSFHNNLNAHQTPAWKNPFSLNNFGTGPNTFIGISTSKQVSCSSSELNQGVSWKRGRPSLSKYLDTKTLPAICWIGDWTGKTTGTFWRWIDTEFRRMAGRKECSL